MIKLKKLITEYGPNQPDVKKQWAVVLKGGSIGSGKGWNIGGMPIRYSFDSEAKAKDQAKYSNKRLSPGEKKHYGMEPWSKTNYTMGRWRQSSYQMLGL